MYENENINSHLGQELETYLMEGVSLWLNGNPSTPGEIVKACTIEEEGVYMRDYIHNERGRMEKLQFDLVKNI